MLQGVAVRVVTKEICAWLSTAENAVKVCESKDYLSHQNFDLLN